MTEPVSCRGGRRRLCAKAGAAIFAIAVIAATAGCATAPEAGRLQSRTVGSGPVVAFQSGLGDGLGVWGPVQAGLAGDATTFALSRAGYGQSPGREGDHSPCAAAAELRRELQAAQLAPPYVLVGHSLGGLYQYAFARLYPGEVAGLVLVEPTHPEHWTRLQQEAPVVAGIVKAARLSPLFTSAMRQEFDDQQRCLEQIESKPVPAVPTRVLVRGEFVALEAGAFERMSRQLWLDWPKRVNVTHVEPVGGSGHYVQKDKPQSVAEAVRGVLRQARPAARAG